MPSVSPARKLETHAIDGAQLLGFAEDAAVLHLHRKLNAHVVHLQERRSGIGRRKLVCARTVDPRHSAEEHARVVGFRLGIDVVDRSRLDDFAAAHHDDALGHARNDAHVVRDERDRGFCVLAQVFDQIEHLRLHRGVERGGRLVGDEQRGLGHHRHRNHDALAHAAGQFVRILRKAPGSLRNADALQPLDRTLPRGGDP